MNKKLILALLLSYQLPAQSSEIASSTWQAIRRYHLDTATAALIPGYLAYHYIADQKPEDVVKDAQTLLYQHYNQMRAFTVEQVNNAHYIITLSAEELKNYIKSNAAFASVGIGMLTGGLYFLLTRATNNPTKSSGSQIHYLPIIIPAYAAATAMRR